MQQHNEAEMLARSARRRNVIDMAVSFTSMIRVLARGSKGHISNRLEALIDALESLGSSEDFERLHSSECIWLRDQIITAQKSRRDGTIKPSQPASFGQAAKVLDISLKVMVHYCALPSAEGAARLRPWLHGAIDTPIMRHLKSLPGAPAISARTIEQIDEPIYWALQKLMARDIQRAFGGAITSVEYDDIMWERLNRPMAST